MYTFIRIPALHTEHGILPADLVSVVYKSHEYYRIISELGGIEDDSAEAMAEYNNVFELN